MLISQFWFIFCALVVLGVVLDLLLDPNGGPE